VSKATDHADRYHCSKLESNCFTRLCAASLGVFARDSVLRRSDRCLYHHVKWAAAMADPVRSAQASAPGTIAPLNIPAAEKLAEAATISPSHPEGSSSRNTTQIHSGTMSSMRTSTPNYISGDELATAKRRTSIRIVRKSGGPTPPARGRSAGPTLPRAWSRANSSRNGKAVLIAIWHQTFKRSQNKVVSLLALSARDSIGRTTHENRTSRMND
jgi:hypothetical protein